MLNRVKLIAEPWDVGPGGYQLGAFPTGWSEWNDRFRDTVRSFWRGEHATVPRLAGALTGSTEQFGRRGRTPQAGINFVACHDGFTLVDLVSYDHKHNEANAEDNRDGTNDNRSWNCGVEGPTDEVAVRALRARQQRNLVATVLLSAGVPMLGAGDEIGRTQLGNNNAYCQDNELSWLDWDEVDSTLRQFVVALTALRRNHRVLRRTRFATGQADPVSGVIDVRWFDLTGAIMTSEQWADERRRSLAVLLDGRVFDANEPSLFVVLHSEATRSLVRLPPLSDAGPTAWQRLLDTANPTPHADGRLVPSGERVRIEAHSLAVFSSL